MKTFYTDFDNGDLVVMNGEIVFAYDSKAIISHVNMRIRIKKGEEILYPKVGLPEPEDVDISVYERLLNEEISLVEGVKSFEKSVSEVHGNIMRINVNNIATLTDEEIKAKGL